jgi:hypothetical protein
MKTPSDGLDEALAGTDWNANVTAFRAERDAVQRIADRTLRLATWAKQFEIADVGNPALSFVREMQVSAQHVAALTALALYKPAASAMRSMVECALYYTYFRSHHSELATLLRDTTYFVDKAFLIDYHKIHTSEFTTLQSALGLVAKLTEWYKRISAITHGQIPGKWVSHTSLAGIRPVRDLLSLVVEAYCQGEELVHSLFLCTAGRELWQDFSASAKRSLLSGLNGDVKATLGLDIS